MWRRINPLFMLVVFILFPTKDVIGWDYKTTHKDMSTKAVEKSVLSGAGGDYLKNLGFDKGIEEEFTWEGPLKTVKEWIEDGGEKEDAGNIFTAYYYNHFHNPLLSWDQAGLKTVYPLINGESSLLWAQDTSNPWSWQKARDYYYLALTISTDIQRSENFAKTFKGLGHLIHLIQDAVQPAHVRNDQHPLDDIGIISQFEYWAKNPDNQNDILSFMSNPIFPAVSLSTPIESYIPISQFWDTDQYNGNNPPIGTAIGISEYINANFFSENTIFADAFPYPAWSSVVEYDEIIDTNTGEVRTYLKKTGDGEVIQHLAAARWFYKYLPIEYKRLGLKLDDNVYRDYAPFLIPRAVGYSAALLDYFFRGEIDMVPDDETGSGYVIKNNTGEYMEGTFRFYYDNTNDERVQIQNGDFPLIGVIILGNGESGNIDFTAPDDAKEPGKYILVFTGRLGNEIDAVVGKVIKEDCWLEPWGDTLTENYPWQIRFDDWEVIGEITVAPGDLFFETKGMSWYGNPYYVITLSNFYPDDPAKQISCNSTLKMNIPSTVIYPRTSSSLHPSIFMVIYNQAWKGVALYFDADDWTKSQINMAYFLGTGEISWDLTPYFAPTDTIKRIEIIINLFNQNDYAFMEASLHCAYIKFCPNPSD